MGKNYTIGLLGGMGPQATSDLFQRLVDSFPGKKDWERPHILVDCFSEMPSRVRAVLYNERRDELQQNLKKSIDAMLSYGADRIFAGCHTAHIFLQELLKTQQEFQGYVLNILDLCRDYCVRNDIHTVRLLASEGTVETGIYEKYLSKDHVQVINPSSEELMEIREYIEAVKQSRMDEDVLARFREMVSRSDIPVILGCSELPVIYRNAFLDIPQKNTDIIDPLQCAIDFLKLDFEDWQRKTENL